MAEETEFTVGTQASCSDGLCGEVSRMIIDPGTRRLTHLVIGPKDRRELGRLVPIDLVDSTSGEVRLRCTLAEFGNLDAAEETELAEYADSGGHLDLPPLGGLLSDYYRERRLVELNKCFTIGPCADQQLTCNFGRASRAAPDCLALADSPALLAQVGGGDGR